MSNTPGALIAMSGGVDSTVAAYLMKQAGCRCMGATMRLYQNEDLGQSGFHIGQRVSAKQAEGNATFLKHGGVALCGLQLESLASISLSSTTTNSHECLFLDVGESSAASRIS